MTYEDLGYNATLQCFRVEQGLAAFEVGRVISEHKERYTIRTPLKEYDTELVGNLRFTAENRFDLPAVGDWVAFAEFDEDKGLIHAVYPRRSILERPAVGKKGQVQIIATNIDVGLIIQSVDRDYNLNRIERYLTICHATKVEPIIVLSKIDLINESDLTNIIEQIHERVKEVSIVTVSNEYIDGYDALTQVIKKGRTYCLLGSSGVGKSTLLNNISGRDLMKTNHISSSVNKGRHTTSHRELVVMQNGGILIDNPGMREVGVSDSLDGLEATFQTIIVYAEDCKFSDCTHAFEKGCAVLQALENGEIDQDSYNNFKKMERERQHFESSLAERKQKDKNMGKLIKNILKQRRHDKY